MKFETLISRYKNIGYIPKNVEPEIELEFLINFLFAKYDRFIGVSYYEKYSMTNALRKVITDIEFSILRMVIIKYYLLPTNH